MRGVIKRENTMSKKKTKKQHEHLRTTGASCTCLRVHYSPVELEDGSLRERWICPDCRTEFVKKDVKSYERKLKEVHSNKYGEGNPEEAKTALEEAQAEWTDHGWVVPENLHLDDLSLTKLPLISYVGGDLICDYNLLTSLEGAPQEVGGSFYCGVNKLTTLEGAPQKVGDDFACHDNELVSLEGAPQEVGGDFDCHNNPLTTLKGSPQIVGGSYSCDYCELENLNGMSQDIGEDISCGHNKLISLKGAPRKINGHFWCNDNQLSFWDSAPFEVNGSVDCSGNPLTTTKGIPQKIGGDFVCDEDRLDFSTFKKKQALDAFIKELVEFLDRYKTDLDLPVVEMLAEAMGIKRKGVK